MVKRVLFSFFEEKVKKQNEGELPLIPLLYPKKIWADNEFSFCVT